MESDFHRLRRLKTDLDPRIWFLRIHDYGLVRLHIYELVIDLFYGFQGKFLIFFGVERVCLARKLCLTISLGQRPRSHQMKKKRERGKRDSHRHRCMTPSRDGNRYTGVVRRRRGHNAIATNSSERATSK
jgi:hypothetical protein